MRFAATEDGDDDEHPRELVARDAPVPIKNIFFFPPWGRRRRRRRRRFLSRRPVVETVLRIIDCGIESRRTTKKRGGEFLFVFERNFYTSFFLSFFFFLSFAPSKKKESSFAVAVFA